VQFDLVCDRAGLSELSQTVLSIGNGVGGVLCPWLSDVYGRKRMTVVCQFFQIGLTILNAFSPFYSVLLVSKFCIGVVQTVSITI
jgi:MFS family permease